MSFTEIPLKKPASSHYSSIDAASPGTHYDDGAVLAAASRQHYSPMPPRNSNVSDEYAVGNVESATN